MDLPDLLTPALVPDELRMMRHIVGMRARRPIDSAGSDDARAGVPTWCHDCPAGGWRCGGPGAGSILTGGGASPTSSFGCVGRSAWLPSGTSRGAVWLAAHLYDRREELVTFDYARFRLPFGDRLAPGDQLRFDIDLPCPPHAGVVVFDLVSEGVAWFEDKGSKPFHITINVR
jgi:hypothetical protein